MASAAALATQEQALRACALRDARAVGRAVDPEEWDVERMRLVACLEGLLKRLAARLLCGRSYGSFDREDLLAVGRWEVLECLQNYDLASGVLFSTLAASRCLNRMREAFAFGATPVCIPLNAQRLIWRRDAPNSRRQRFQPATVRAVEAALRRVAAEVLDRTPAETPRPGADLERREEREKIDRFLARLNERSRAVIVGRFGLDGSPPRTLKDLGRQFGVTRQRIRNIEQSALKRYPRPKEEGRAPERRPARSS